MVERGEPAFIEVPRPKASAEDRANEFAIAIDIITLGDRQIWEMPGVF
jgi:hypothetical protein